MSILFELGDIVRDCEEKAKHLLEGLEDAPFSEEIVLRNEKPIKADNMLYYGDNVDAILDLIKRGQTGSIDLIYIDPPFYTKANYKKRVIINYLDEKKAVEYKAYTDTYEDGFTEYLEILTIRLFLMRELLSNRGSIYIHIDFRTVHYIKVIMDYIFGEEYFLNEIIWSYKSGGSSKKYYSRKHDNILVYTKTKDYIFHPQKEKSYNRGFKPYCFKGVREYEDELGWYTLVNLKDVWQINMVGRTSKERVGYETQKPEALLERIILTSTDEDSIVADFFAGSGTTLSVAEKNNRRWIGSDYGNSSILTVRKRLATMDSKPYRIIKFNEDTGIGNIRIKKAICNKIDNNEYRINIRLDRYEVDLDSLNLRKKDVGFITEISNKDSLLLLDYVSVNIGDEDSTVIYEDYKDHESIKIREDFQFNINSLDKEIKLNVIDIFGNTSTRIVNL